MTEEIQHRYEYSFLCLECGEKFVTEFCTAKYCGKRCAKKAQNRRTYQNRKERLENEVGQPR